ncbi:MAG: prepilin-type N-terminal cleavage/methylation domain-containing protein [Vampirovibrionales bacterium]|nr:prepilin-type N-terminal cleavage/methylation domain-containing protein [Vampirovibrionales bacterium]
MIRSAKSGFTLIELAIVLCIIAILVAMAALNFSNNVAKAELGALRSLTSQVRTACAMELSEQMDPALVDLTNFIDTGDANELLVTPAACTGAATALSATALTCEMTKQQAVITYNPVNSQVTAVYTDVA